MKKRILKSIKYIVLLFMLSFIFLNDGFNNVNVNAEETTYPFEYTEDTSEILASGTGWTLTENGTLTITSSNVSDSIINSTSSYYTLVKNIVFNGKITINSTKMNSYTNLENVYAFGTSINFARNSFASSKLIGLYCDTDSTLIYNSAFANCSKLKYIYIKKINQLISYTYETTTFYNCSSLESVVIDNTADKFTLGAGAFKGAGSTNGFKFECSGTNVTLEKEVFLNSKVTEIVLNTTNTVINESVFSNCSNLKSLYISHIKSLSSNGSVQQFSNCPSLESIVFANTTQGFTLNGYAFANSGSNSGFTFECTGNNVSIGQNAFYNSKLIKAVLNTTNTEIYGGAFASCTLLKSIYVKHIKTLYSLSGSQPFLNCTSLENVSFASVVDGFTIQNQAFQNAGSTNGFELKLEGKNVEIGQSAFVGSNVTKVVLNTTNTVIYEAAFSSCTLLKSVYIQHIKTLYSTTGSQPFLNCTSLESVVFANTTKGFTLNNYAFEESGSENGFTFECHGENFTIGQGAFAKSNVIKVTLNTTNTVIGEKAFSECKLLKEVHIKQLTQILSITGSSAFYNCTSLEIFEIELASNGSICLENIDESKTGLIIDAFAFEKCGCSDGFNFEIKNGIVTINQHAFVDSTVKDVKLNTTNTIIYDQVFESCTLLKTVYIKHLKTLSSDTGEPFCNCTSLESIVIDDTIDGFNFPNLSFYKIGSANGFTFKCSGKNVSIGQKAFAESNVKEVIFNTTNTIINEGVFANCSLLKTVYVKHVKTLWSITGNSPFYNCSSLESVVFASVVDGFIVKYYTFQNAGVESGFDFILEGNNIEIENSAFVNSTVIKIVLNTTNTIIDQTAFANCPLLKNVYIKHIKTLTAGIDGSQPFYNCPSLESVVFDDTIDGFTIQSYAFKGTGSSEGFTFLCNGTNVTIDASAFLESKIKKVKMNTSNTVISGSSFANCTLLEEIFIKELGKFNYYAGSEPFYGCSNLSDVTIGDLEMNIDISSSIFNPIPKANKLTLYADTLTIGDSAIAIQTPTLLISANDVSFGTNAFITQTSSIAYINDDIENKTSVISTLQGFGFTVNEYHRESNKNPIEEVEFIYNRVELNEYHTLVSIVKKDLTTFTINDKCEKIAAGAFDNLTSMAYNEYGNGLYIGTDTNPYYALIKCLGDITLHEDVKIFADDAFNGLNNINVTIPAVIKPFSVNIFNALNTATITIPKEWQTISYSDINESGLLDLSSSSHVNLKFENGSNIKYLTDNETSFASNHNYTIKNTSARIISYAHEDLESENEIHVGDMLKAVITGYDGVIVYTWNVGSGTKYRIFLDTDTEKDSFGIKSNEANKHYTTPYIATMDGDGVTSGMNVSVKAYALTSDGICYIAQSSSTLQALNLSKSIPDEYEITLKEGETKTFDSVLVDMGVPHAIKCVTTNTYSIQEGAEFVSIVQDSFVCNYVGTAKLVYNASSTDCYCHGGTDSCTGKILYVHVIPADNSFHKDNNNISIVVVPLQYEYDGETKTPTITVRDLLNDKDLVEGIDYLITADSVLSAVNRGYYDITFEGINNYRDSRTITWKITKKLNTIISKIDDYTYGDEPSDPEVIGNKTDNQPTYKYKLKGASDDTYTDAQPTIVGTYILLIEIEENDNYESVYEEIEFKVNKKPLTVTIDSKESVYGSDIVELTSTTTGIVEGDTNVYKIETLATKSSDVGKYDITGTTLNDNYLITFNNETESYTIKPMDVEIVWSIDDYTYNRNVQTITAYYLDKDSAQVELTVVVDKEFINADDYTATASFKNAEINYKLPDTVTKSYTIKRKSIKDDTITKELLFESKVFENKELVNTLTIKDGDVTLIVDTEYTITGSLKETNVNSYTITVTGINNYINSVELTWKITKKTFTTTITQDDFIYGEDDDTKKPVKGVNESDGVEKLYYKLAIEDDSKYTDVRPENAGEYIIKFVIEETSNYEESTATDTFTIIKADYIMDDVLFNDDTKVYNYKLQGLTITGELPIGLDGIKLTVSYTEGRTDVGEVTITATFSTTSPNYNTPDPKTAKLTITPLMIEKPAEDKTTYTYNGVMQTYATPEASGYTVSNNTRTNAGSQDVTYTLIDKINTIWTDSTTDDVVYVFKVNKKELTVTVNSFTKEFNTDDPKFTYSEYGLVNGDILTVILTRNEGDTAGTYDILSNITYDELNYNLTLTPGTLTIKEKENDDLAEIKISVIEDENGNPIKNATVELWYIERLLDSGLTDTNGYIEFNGLVYGNYSVVVKYEDTIVTKAYDVYGETYSDTIKVPKSGVNTILNGNAATSVDNLYGSISDAEKESAFNSKDSTVTITMSANYTEEKEVIDSINKFARKKDKNTLLIDFIDVNITKSLNESGSNKNEVIKETVGFQNVTFEISEDIWAKINEKGVTIDYIICYREHENSKGKTEIVKLPKVLESEGTDAKIECFFVKAVNDRCYLTIHVKNFSTYAFGLQDTPVKISNSDHKCFIHWFTLVLTILFIAFEVLFFIAKDRDYDKDIILKEISEKEANEILKTISASNYIVDSKGNTKEYNNELIKYEVEKTYRSEKKNKLFILIDLASILVFTILYIILFILGDCTFCTILFIIDIILTIIAILELLYLFFYIDNSKDLIKVRLFEHHIFESEVEEELNNIIDDEALKSIKGENNLGRALNDMLGLVPALTPELLLSINKTTIADYVDTIKNTITNRKPDRSINNLLYRADTHYIVNKNNKRCFIYVYQDLENKKVFLLVKLLPEELIDEKKKHNLIFTSRYPIGCKWCFIGIDESFTFEDIKKIINKAIEVNLKETSEKEVEIVDETSKSQSDYMSTKKDSEGNIIK